MAKEPYDDKLYHQCVGEIESAADRIFNMEGSDKETVESVFDQVLDNLEDEDDEEAGA